MHRTILLSIFAFLVFGFSSYAQLTDLKKAEKELVAIHTKMSSFVQRNGDSLELYSNLFTSKLSGLLKKNLSTLNYPFKILNDSTGCIVSTSADGLLRTYSWDTWQGGSMHDYNTIYQYRSGNKIHVIEPVKEAGDMGSFFKKLFTIDGTNDKKYYLAVCSGTYSTSQAYETVIAYKIENDTLNRAEIFKTGTGWHSSITFDYDFFSVADRPERPLRLIKYDSETLYIPVVLDGGKVTNRFILYQWTGGYFERIVKKN